MAHDEKQIQKRNRITYMILSVVIAVAAWALVAFATNPDISKTFYNLNVVVKGGETLMDNELVVTNADGIRNLAVKLIGKRVDLIDAIDKVTVEVDVSSITEPGEYDLKGTVVLPNSRISVDKVKFSSVPITVEKYVTADIPVRIETTGGMKDKLIEFIPTTETLAVSGAKSELEFVSEAVVDVDSSMIKEAGKQNYMPRLLDDDGLELKNLKTVSNPNYEIEAVIYDYKELPIKPVLHESLKNAYEIDYENTSVKPSKVGVGILEGTEVKELTVVIDKVANEESEYKIVEQDGVYIPSGSRTVTVKPEIKDMGAEQPKEKE